MTTEVNNTSAILAGLGINRPGEVKEKDSEQDQFLNLMIAQLKNQDPFKPLESGEFLTQIAQFGTVTGVKELQSSFSQLASSISSNQALQASSLVGRTVNIESNAGVLGQDSPLSGTVELEGSTDELTVTIESLSGQALATLNLGTQASGSVPFAWNGVADNGTQLAPGTYQVRATARSGGETSAAPTYIDARVDSVTLGGQGNGLEIGLRGLGQVAFSDIREVK
jgi:flagellar basal-body rod modification protein FlgD